VSSSTSLNGNRSFFSVIPSPHRWKKAASYHDIPEPRLKNEQHKNWLRITVRLPAIDMPARYRIVSVRRTMWRVAFGQSGGRTTFPKGRSRREAGRKSEFAAANPQTLISIIRLFAVHLAEDIALWE
jgi:hypothetical protein